MLRELKAVVSDPEVAKCQGDLKIVTLDCIVKNLKQALEKELLTGCATSQPEVAPFWIRSLELHLNKHQYGELPKILLLLRKWRVERYILDRQCSEDLASMSP